MRATRVTIPRNNISKAPMRVSRPATLQTEFLSAGAALKGLCASFAGIVLSPLRKAFAPGERRGTLVVEANNKKGLGSTTFGTRRKRARVSGFRTRMATPGGRKVLKARRKKGRKNIAPGGRPVRK
jgi:large subunit ribosomal protein L34